MAFLFTVPKKTIAGVNALQESKEIMQRTGKSAFIVTGKNITKSGMVKELTDLLDSWGIRSCVFNEITGEPTVTMIEEGVATYKKTNCDFLIGFGGGSPLDSTKAIAAMSVLPGTIADYLGKEMDGKFPPMVLIPTTAGTGSETTKFTIITDEEKGIKMLLKGASLLPDVAILDPKMTLLAPRSVTAATGMDALTHAIESYTSRKGNAFTDIYALSAIKRIFSNLPLALEDSMNLKAREEMLIAAFEAGVCINNASVTLVHGMSRPIGALFHVPHGISNAMLLKECLSYVMEACPERFEEMANAIGIKKEEDTAVQMGEKFLFKLGQLCEICQIPTLKEYGIDQNAFDLVKDKMAGDAIASGSPSNTIKEITKEDILILYDRLWK